METCVNEVIYTVRDPVDKVLNMMRAAIQGHDMIESGDTVVCAVSGGPDSMCLLDGLLFLFDEFDFGIHVAHLHHHMRGEQADKDAQLVVDFCKSRGIQVTVEHEEVFRLAETLKIGVEEAGRIARYKFLFELKEQIEAQKIAMGHHMNDQAETVIMRLARGAGTQGLAGIPPVNDSIIRPLIHISRSLIEEYCLKRKLPVITDVYNLDLKYTRNLVRYKILPEMAGMLNPSLVETLSRTAQVLRWDSEFLEKEATMVFAGISMKQGRVTLVDDDKLQSLPKALSSRVLEKAWRECAGETGNLNVDHVMQVLDPGEETVSLPGDVTAHRHLGQIGFYPPPPKDLDISLKVPGLTAVPELGLCVSTRVFDKPEGLDLANDRPRKGLKNAPGHVNLVFMLELGVWTDYNKCEDGIRLRTRRPGDRFKPLGMQGREKKIQDLLVSMRIPRYYRSFVPIFVSGEQIIWVGGLRLSEQFRVRQDTCKILEIALEPFLRHRLNGVTI
ncbi:MAG: tRNA lysidine(34) synthetase TilS [Bacillota bacterium]